MTHNPIYLAIDTKDVSYAHGLVDELKDHVGGIKLGLEFFIAHGPKTIEEFVAKGLDIFLDLKLHDIPNQVKGAAESAARLGIKMLTIHASGGRDMMQAALDGASKGATEAGVETPLILGVTVLTSLNEKSIQEIGFSDASESQVLRLAYLARDAGLKGLVSSAKEVTALRNAIGNDMTLVTPGIRPAWAASDDQSRIVTPSQAVKDGADYLVIGRPITSNSNPVDAAQKILDELNLS